MSTTKLDVVVIGAGRMGLCTAVSLEKLGCNVTILEPYDKVRAEANIVLKNLDSSVHILPPSKVMDRKFHIPALRCVISTAPYHCNYKYAIWAKENKIPYCDLGGNTAASLAIKNMSKLLHPEVPVFTCLGLAPGLCSVLAHKVFNEYSEKYDKNPEYIRLRVGGLPVEPIRNSALKYNIVFSPDGLLSEYSGKCSIIKEGKVCEVDALEDWDVKNYYPIIQGYTSNVFLESFNTSGGINQETVEEFAAKGIKFMSYQTLRYPGHRNIIKFLLKECKTTPQQFSSLIKQACPETKKDVAYIYVEASRGLGEKKIIYSNAILYDEHWTAMQKATSYPFAAVAYMLANGEFEAKPVLNYSDVKLDRFFELLGKLDEKKEF